MPNSTPESKPQPKSAPSSPARAHRQRQTVLFADLVESVRLFQSDEHATIARWLGFVTTVRDGLASAHGGRLVRTAGDGLLMAFASPAGGLAAAFALHGALRPFNLDQAESAQMGLRIGIHVADVVDDTDELYGSGVNVASRLASVAQPGQTVVSAQTRAEVVDAVHGDFEDLGLRYVKHLDEPLHVHLATPPGSGRTAAAAPRQPAADLRPTVAVVPFVALPADPQHDALGHAMVGDIIDSLARHPSLRVLSRQTTAAVRDVQLELPRLRELLGATFLLSGTFYVRGDRIRLLAELCELQGGQVLWAGTVRADVNDLFEGQDDLVPQLVAQVAQHVMAHEITRVHSLPMDSLASYSLFLGAGGLMNSLVRDDFARAESLLQHLVDRHPRQAAPYAMLARWHVFKAVQGWTAHRAEDAARARSLAQMAIETDPRQAVALSTLALVRANFEGDLEAAQRDNLAAIEADPVDPHAWAQLAGVQTLLGEHTAACASAAQALRASPLDPALYLFEAYAAMAHMAAGDHTQAIVLAQSSVRRHALHAPSHRILVGSLWLAGRQPEARLAAQRYLRFDPTARARTASRNAPQDGEHWRTAFAQALQAAGLPA
jgi:adenylate cyclase